MGKFPRIPNTTPETSAREGFGNLRPQKVTMDENEEMFEDAAEEIQLPSSVDLEPSIQEAHVALNLFLNNRFELAKSRMEPLAKQSMYHAVGNATVVFIRALMTCESKDIEEAAQVTKEASHVCDRFRQRNGYGHNAFTKLVNRSEKSLYTDVQMHAELCYAETLLQRALLTFIQDENLVSFVKGALKIRECYKSYKECQRILLDKDCWPNPRNEKLRAHFESGVRMGIGTFNLMISTLPSRVLRLLEFVGFSGDKTNGLQQLENGSASAEETLRGPMCSLVLLSWHLIFSYIIGNGDADLPACQRMLAPLSRNYPKGSLVLYFAGRFEEVRANIPEAIRLLHQSIDSQSEWRQFHHLCYWELTFCYAFVRQWSKSAEYAHKLYAENRWSKCSYAYMSGVFLLANESSVTNGGKGKGAIDKLFKEVPILKVRIAGKSIPMEKFCVMKADRYFKKGRLPLAHYELLYLWNGFSILGKDTNLLKPVLAEIESVMQTDLDPDDYCLGLLLKAMCLKHLQSPFQAEQCLTELVSNEKRVTDNYYLIPSALFELSLLKFNDCHMKEAKEYLAKARTHKGYAMESRLHFRMHALSDRLSLMTPE